MEFGKNCSKPDCNILDFLPIQCKLCGNEFCKHHSEYSSHGCKLSLPQYNYDFPLSYPCTIINCKEKSLTAIHCNTCGRMTCIKHTQKEMHKCSGLKVTTASEEPKLDLISLRQQLSTFDKPISVRQEAKPLTEAQRKQKLKINLIKLKMNAKSPRNCFIVEQDKCFLQLMDQRTNGNLSLLANRKWGFRRIFDFVIDSWLLSSTTDIRVVSQFSGREIDIDSDIADLFTANVVADGDCLVFHY